MDPKFRSSFIPKRAITSETTKPRRRRGVGIVSAVSGLLFILSLIAAGGALGYEFFLKDRIHAKGIELETKRPFVDSKRVGELKALHNRLRVARDLVTNHVAFSLLFDHLENITLQDVQYVSYSHVLNPDGTVQITLNGITRNYGTLALQSQAFSRSNIIEDATFSNFTLDERGNVIFQIKASLDSRMITYSNTL